MESLKQNFPFSSLCPSTYHYLPQHHASKKLLPGFLLETLAMPMPLWLLYFPVIPSKQASVGRYLLSPPKHGHIKHALKGQQLLSGIVQPLSSFNLAFLTFLSIPHTLVIDSLKTLLPSLTSSLKQLHLQSSPEVKSLLSSENFSLRSFSLRCLPSLWLT